MASVLPLYARVEKAEIRRPVFRYQGGKFRIADWIIPFFPKHKIYVEPFGGSGGVLFQKPRSQQEVYNDTDCEVVHVFKVLRDKEKAKELQRLLELTPWSRREYYETCSTSEEDNDIEKARKTIARSYMSISAGGIARKNSGFQVQMKQRECNIPQCKAWTNYPQQIMEFCKRLQGVVIENKDGMEIIKQYDTDKTLHYVDPPYVLSMWNKNHHDCYKEVFTDEKHAELIELLNSVKGYVVLSGYKTDMYMDLLKGWHMEKKETINQRNQPRTEYIWISPRAWEERVRQKTLWGG